MATRRDRQPPHDHLADADTDRFPPIQAEPDAAPTPPTPADEKIKLGLAAVLTAAWIIALAKGHDIMAAAFGTPVIAIVGHYFNRKGR